MAETAENMELKSFVRCELTGEQNKYGTGSAEAWKRHICEWVWKLAPEDKLLGAEHEIRYATNLTDLCQQMELEDPAPAGSTFYWIHEISGWRADKNHLCRLRYPLIYDDYAGNAIELAEREKVVYVFISCARKLFALDDVGRLLKNTVVLGSCLLKPAESLHGPLSLVYAPKAAQSLSTKNTRLAEKKKKAKEEADKRAAEAALEEQFQRIMQKDAAARMGIIVRIHGLLTDYVEWQLGITQADVAPVHVVNEALAAGMLLRLLQAFRKLKFQAVTAFVPGPEYRHLRETNKLHGQACKDMRWVTRKLRFYSEPAKHLRGLPDVQFQGSGSSEPREKIVAEHSKTYQQLFVELRKLEQDIARRKSKRS